MTNTFQYIRYLLCLYYMNVNQVAGLVQNVHLPTKSFFLLTGDQNHL